MKKRLIDADELIRKLNKRKGAFAYGEGQEPFMVWELEDIINDMADDEYATSIFIPCSHGEGVTVRPDGVHELSPHAYKLTQKLRNVTVEVLTCETCGDVSVAWYRQEDTEEVTDDV